jgi:CDP-4-dehydro-6-deoxyglucose reductase
MSCIKLTSGKSFNSYPKSTILDAVNADNIFIPYSCKTGRCSTCKCKVVSGSTIPLHKETGLTDQEMADGWVLSCVRSAETDVVIEVDDLGGLKLPVAKTFPCRIREIIRLTPDVVRVLLRLPPTADFHFIPGQYIDIIGANGLRRSYSLANSTFSDKVLELHIRAVEGGAMSQYWFNQAKPNDLLRLNGPLGTFFLRETANIDLIFLATGTGIAPVKAMLESIIFLTHEKQPKTVTVLWGGRNAQDLYLNVADFPGNHIYIPVRSRANEGWSGAIGYVQDVLVDLVPNLSNAKVYACGSDNMIRSAKKRVVEAGLPAKHFYSDAFVSSGAK